MEDSGTSVHPVNVSWDPGEPPFQIESPCRQRRRVWIAWWCEGVVDVDKDRAELLSVQTMIVEDSAFFMVSMLFLVSSM